jgi:hypothetical protein
MMRSKRKAAHDAVLRMREIFEWEDVRENSKVFQSCAAKIDMEFERELKKKRLGVQDIEDECCEDDEESSSEEELEVLTREDIEFIEDDGFQHVDKTWMPSKKKKPPGVRQLIDSVSATSDGRAGGVSAGEDPAEDSECEDSAEDSECEDAAEDAAEDSECEDSECEDSECEDSECEDAAEDAAEECEDAAEDAAEDAEDSECEDSAENAAREAPEDSAEGAASRPTAASGQNHAPQTDDV